MRPSAVGVLLTSVFLSVQSSVSACELTTTWTGYVRDGANCSVQQHVLVFSTTRHNHWESPGTFEITGESQTGNSWSAGAEAGYEASVSAKAGVVAEVAAAASVHFDVSGKLSGDKVHKWAVNDTTEKQFCKCPVYKEFVNKPTESGYNKKITQWINCDGVTPPEVVSIDEWATGTATGDRDTDAGVFSSYNYRQEESECEECYGTYNTCPGAGL